MATTETEKSDFENYLDKVRAMSGQEKLAIAFQMTRDDANSIQQQVLEEQPDLQGQALKIAVARRVYHDCPGTQKLLEEVEKELQTRTGSNDPNLIF